MRSDFLNRAKVLFETQASQHKKRVSEFSRLAKSQGVDPSDVILDLTLGDTSESANQSQGLDDIFEGLV
jgi:hypothetical protein